MTVGIDSYPPCFPNGIGLAHIGKWVSLRKRRYAFRSLRSGQEFGDSVPDTPVKKGMHIFFTLRSVSSVATNGGCVESDVPGHAPL